ncbi:hypothetical protein Lepto7375DRAFT_7394 [Leptolyngbya sp. PCC 7375]|nr:hypothetical protein Lepto7375DRAFT_7394 [Leptolyngbya sp. PCC 7375]
MNCRNQQKVIEMDQDKALSSKPVSFSITKEGDFTFSGNVSEYEVTAMIEAWRQVQSQRSIALKSGELMNGVVRFFGRFSGLFPLVLLLWFGVFVVQQCSAPQPTLTQPYQQRGTGNAY